MFYSHAVAVPMFLLLGNELTSSARRWFTSSPLPVVGVPVMIALLVLNVITQLRASVSVCVCVCVCVCARTVA